MAKPQIAILCERGGNPRQSYDIEKRKSIDTNGEKGPNQTGKDLFTRQVTPMGIRGLGNATLCDSAACGGYILANHKL